MNERRIRRMAGHLAVRLPELRLDAVTDPRRGPTKWRLVQFLTATLVGLMAGCRSLADLEQLSELFSPAVRRKLKLGRRVPDTTLRDALCKLSIGDLRACLHRAVKGAARRKALGPVGFPFGVLALDGKATSVGYWDGDYVQKHEPEHGAPVGMARTVTCTLVSAAGTPCLDAIPLPKETNEVGHFKTAFDNVNANFGSLFNVITYDAGGLSEENGRHVVDAGKHYVMRLKGEQRYMFKVANELLDPSEVVAETVDVLSNRTTVTRRLVLLTAQQHWAYGGGRGPVETVWQHARTFVRVESVKTVDGIVSENEARIYVSSLPEGDLTPEQWLLLVRRHWGVESNHHTLDTAFSEDDHPWIEADGRGLMNVLVLRRIAYTLLALFRSVTQRSDKARAMRWKDLLRWVAATLFSATDDHLAGLRPRATDAVCA
jgi:hypothetical protein